MNHCLCSCLCALILFCISDAGLYAQPAPHFPDYHVQIFDESAGIRSHNLRRVVKDQRGFLWLQYPDRILRFDGKHVREFLLPPGQRSILCDDDNRIWSSGITGVFRFENDRKGFIPILPDTGRQLSIGVMLQVTGKKYWLETGKGFYEWNNDTGKFHLLTDSSLKVSSPIITGLSKYSNNFLFFAANDSLYRYDLARLKRNALPLKNCNSLNPLSGDKVLITTWELRSFFYDFSSDAITAVDLRETINRGVNNFFVVNDVLSLPDRKYLVTSSLGLIEFNDSSQTFRKLTLYHNGTPIREDRNFYGLYADNLQNAWISSFQGLIKLPKKERQFGWERNHEADPGRSWNNYVRNFASDEKGNLWLATENGIAYWDINNGSAIYPLFAKETATDKMNHPSIRGLAYDGQHLIIGQTDKGIWLYHPIKKKYSRPEYGPGERGDSIRKKIENEFINQIYTLQSGNHVVAARDVYVIDKQTLQVNEIHIPGKKGNAIFSYQDKRKRIWIATNYALYCMDSTLKFRFKVEAPSNENAIRTMCEWGDELLIGGSSLYRLDFQARNPTLQKLHPFFDDKNIVILYTDLLKRVWLGTENGFYCYDPGTHQIRSFDQQDNVQSNSFYPNSIYRHPNGLLFVGGYRGINYFYPEKQSLTGDHLQVWLTNVTVNEDDSSFISFSKNYRLRYFQNSIQFDFTSPGYSQINKIRYRYRLEPVDSAWIDNGNNNTVRFTSLSPGRYTFRVEASLNGTYWQESSERFSFTIDPPFWRTWWFGTLLLLVSAYGIYRWIGYWRNKIRAQQILNYFATSLYGQNTVDDIFWDIAKNCVRQLNFEDCVVYQYDRRRKMLVQKAAYGPKNPDKHEIINSIEIPLGKGVVGTVAQTGIAEIVGNTSKDSRYIVDDIRRHSEITVPITVDGEVFGVIDSEHRLKNFYRKYHLVILRDIASIAADKISKYIMQEKLRSKISRDLHDEIGSALTSINVLSKVAINKGSHDNELLTYLSRIKESSSRTMESMSDIVWAINPKNDILEKMMSRMREFAADICEAKGIDLKFLVPSELEMISLDLAKRKSLFLVFKEAVNNAVKYSECSLLIVEFGKQGDNLTLSIRDNGSGFQIGRVTHGNGLQNMHERAAECDGRLIIESGPGLGTLVRMEIPITRFGAFKYDDVG